MRFFADLALLPTGPAARVRFDVLDGRFAAVTPHSDPAGASRLPGIVLPGFANAHSHAFHRALRGRTHDGAHRDGVGTEATGTSGARAEADAGTFWTWRQAMYGVAARLDPASYLALARAAYAEMACAGITGVAEFHYLHHQPDGIPYDRPECHGCGPDPGRTREAGIRLTLLDTCYLTGGLDGSGYRPLDDHQRRFGDRDVERLGPIGCTRAPPRRVSCSGRRSTPSGPSRRAALPAVVAGRPRHCRCTSTCPSSGPRIMPA